MASKSFLSHCKKIVGIAMPILGVRLLYMGVGFIGMLFIARLGKAELAAGALVTTLVNTLLVIATSPLLAVSITVSRHLGEGKAAEVGGEVKQAWIASLGIGTLCWVLLWNLSPLLIWLHEPSELIPLVEPYLRGLAWGVIPSFLVASCHQLFFPARKGNLVVVFSTLNLVVTVAAGTALMHGYAGLPRLGMTGWAYGVSVSNWVVLATVFSYLHLSKHFRQYRLFEWRGWLDGQRLAAFLKLGFPITLQFSSELLAFSAINLMVGWLGVEALGIQQILVQYSMLALMVPMGVGQACTILIGHALGRHDKHQVTGICKAGVGLVAACMAGIGLVYLLAPRELIGLYIGSGQHENSRMVSLTTLLLSVLAVSQLADAIRNTVIGALRGLRDVWSPMWINLILLWALGLPLGYFFAFPLKQGQLGLNLGVLAAFAAGAVGMWWRFLYLTRGHRIGLAVGA